MSTKHPDLFAALAAPFEAGEVKVRAQAGRQFHYITARTVMNRLDTVLGPENWWDEYDPHENSVLCRLTIRLPDGSTLTKCDAGGYAGMSDSGDDDKSGYSDAFKRAGVKFGVGRYLYRDGVPCFADAITTTDGHPSPVSTPCPDTRPRGKGPLTEPANGSLGWVHGLQSGPPGTAPAQTGDRLFRWAKKQGEAVGKDLVGYLATWGKRHGFGARITLWNPEQASYGFAEARRKLANLQPQENGR